MGGSQDLQVVAQAFEQAADTFTHQGGVITDLARELVTVCRPLGEQSVGGSQCGTLAQQATGLGRSLDSVAGSGCSGIAGALRKLLATFQEADRSQAANPDIQSQTGGGG